MELSSSNYCIDFGSANVRLGETKSGVLLSEASYAVTYTNESGERALLALGNTALEMYGRIPKILQHVALIRDGTINDFDCMKELVRQLFIQIQQRLLWANQHVIVCHSMSSNSEELSQVGRLLKQAGVRKVRFIPRLLAIANALDLPIEAPQGHCIIDVGAHTTEIGIISCGSIIRNKAFKIGGDTFSLSLQRHLRKSNEVEISLKQADQVKIQFGGCDIDKSTNNTVEIRGRSTSESFPKIVDVDQDTVIKGIVPGATMWLGAIEDFFDELPIELSTDILQTGIYLVGGGAKLDGLDWVVSQRLKVMVFTPDNCSDLCVIGGK